MKYSHLGFSLLAFLINLTNYSFAQTTGPAQPEVQSFQPVSMTNMVDKATGQFQYNIPLFTIGGYPVNVNYNSQVLMENEASMVGLGFNLNCGAITRQVRGIPDDFWGDEINKKVNMKPNRTYGIELGLALELVGLDKAKAKKLNAQYGLNLTTNTGLFYNNYNGWGIENRFTAGFHGNKGGLAGNAGIGITSNSQHGTNINPYVGLGYTYKKAEKENQEKQTGVATKFKLQGSKLKTNGVGMGASLSFNSLSFSPKIDIPFTTYSFDFSLKLGYAGALTQVGGDIKGYYMEQKLQNKNSSNPAYGFMYAEHGKDNLSAIMDFSREKDGIVAEETSNLGLPYGTPDVYSVAGQGIGGTFELRRNNVFIGFDAKAQSNSHAGGAEIELGSGTGAHIGADIRYGYTRNISQKWQSANNEILTSFDFIGVRSANTHQSEEVFFKNPNDVMFNASPAFGSTTYSPLAPKLKKQFGFGGKTEGGILNWNSNSLLISSSTFLNKERQKRLDAIYYLTTEDAALYGIEKKIFSYALNDFSTPPTPLNRTDQYRQKHHLSEMICIKADGSRYIFNIPAYNNEKSEVTWSLNDADVNNNLETASFPNLTTIKNDDKGKDDYVSITETPAYAHSFFLGSVLSANYIDVDDNGPTFNDIGDYVKFNYSRVYDNYFWRSNNKLDVAPASKGNLADNRDSKGFYQEGRKEIWYIHSIESKNEIARFYYSDRQDAFDLKNSSNKLKRLDSIQLYSRPELSISNPKPYKTIYFEYDEINALCKRNINGNAVGKLTLKKIYFNDGTSKKGKYSAYTFGYGYNPNYNAMETDRWENYKQNNNGTGLALTNEEFPFTNQFAGNNATTGASYNDLYASAWLLNKIQLPSGGIIDIKYEAHDYAFVQKKKAMIMTKVIGFTSAIVNGQPAPGINNELYYTSTGILAPKISNNILIFRLKEPIIGSTSSVTANNYVKSEMFTDLNDVEYGRILNNGSTDYKANLYGKIKVKLNADYGYEYIPVFMGARTCGALKLNGETDYNYGYVEIEPEAIEKNGAPVGNPVFKAAGQFIKLNYTGLLFGFDNNPGLSGGESAQMIANFMNPAAKMMKAFMQTSPYKKLLNEDVAKTIDPNGSYIRIYDPTGYKKGGYGARVKQIIINDNWNVMTNATSTNATYTIQYVYTKKLSQGKVISSGVMSYEPEKGAEENPFKQPVYFTTKNTLMPDDNNYLMTPFGEALFPSASIVYSEVRTIQNPVTSSSQKGNGYSVDYFYTNYDFPCIADHSKIELLHKPKLKFSLLKNISRTYLVAAQGYSVATNDMHGKTKAEEVRNEAGDLVSGKYYTYKTSAGRLSNMVSSIDKEGKVNSNQLLGVESSICGDARSFETETFYGSVHGNVDMQIPPPVPAPSFWPDFTYEQKVLNTSVLTKFIRQQGILESVKVVDKGAAINTTNLLWDAETGAVLLTKSNNEFNDPVYNFTYPAHWAYTGMGMTSDNIGTSFNTNPSAAASFITRLLVPGDVVAANTYKYIVTAVNTTSFNVVPLYTTAPALPPGSQILKIIHSAKKNLATSAIGSITSQENPFSANAGTLRLNIQSISPSTHVLDAGATEFSNHLNLGVCDSCLTNRNQQGGINNYILSSSGLRYSAPWQSLAAYKFVEDRIQTPTNPGIRKDGVISRFQPFWNNPVNGQINLSKSNHPNWQFISRLSHIDSKTNPIESYNPLLIFNSGQPSNINGLTYAVSNNARYFENFFESFEELMNECIAKHFQFPVVNTSMLDNSTAHTGFYSVRIPATGFTQSFPKTTLNSKMEKDTSVFKECAIRSLSLVPGKKYIYSAWVKQRSADNITLDYPQASVTINTTSSGAITATPKGQIIDGWQRIETEFVAPSYNAGNFGGFSITYSPNCNYDDIRIFPADGNMKSYVYNYKDFSLMAMLDENNYATFYEYDQQKQLKRVKKETEKGIMTIQEVNFGSYKQ